MEPKTTTCKICGKEFKYYDMADSAMDVGKVPPICDSKMCRTNWKYRERTRNMQTGEYAPLDKINKL
jgi:hypothetical protein